MAQAIDPAHLELILKTMGIENVKEVTKAFEDLQKSAKDSVQPLEEAKTALAEMDAQAQTSTPGISEAGKAAEEAGGKGEGEAGEGGFAGLAAGILKAERAGLALSTGRGVARTGSILESLLVSLGGPAGLGLAIGGVAMALEVILPKLEKFIEKMDGAAEATKRAAEQAKAANEQMAKLAAQPTEEEEAGARAIKPALAGRRGLLVAQGIEQALMAEMPWEEQQFLRRAETVAGLGGPETWETAARRTALRQQLQVRRAEIYGGIEAGRPTDISRVSAMAGQFPGFFPAGIEQQFRQTLPENLEAAKRQAATAEAQSREADDIYARREEAHQETIDIQLQFNKARQDKVKHDMRQVAEARRLAEHDATQEFNEHEKDRRNAEKERHDAVRRQQHDQREEEREAKNQAREMSIPGRMRRQREETEGLVQQALPLATPEFQEKTARHMIENYNMGLAIGHTMEERIYQAMMQTRQDVARGIVNGMKRGQVYTEAFMAEQ